MTLTLNLQTVLIFCCLALLGCRDEEFKTYPPPPLIIEGRLVEMGSYAASGSVYAGFVVEDGMTRKWLTASIYTVNDGTENVDLSLTEVDIITDQTEAVRSAIYPDWIQAKKNKLYKVTLNLHEYGSFSELNNVKRVTAYSDGETIWQMMVLDDDLRTKMLNDRSVLKSETILIREKLLERNRTYRIAVSSFE